MALNLGSLVAKIELNTSQAEQALNNLQNSTGGAVNHFNEVGKKLFSTGAIGVASLAGLAKAGAAWEAQLAGTEFVYKQLDKTIQKSISNGAKEAEALGITAQAYKDGAVELANYYDAMGLTTEQIDNMLASNMELIADLGAIKDIPFETVLSDWKSALMGNHEAIDKYNVTLGESTMNSSEYAKSIGKEVSKMTEKEKLMARLSVIYDHGSSAMGLAKEEAEGFAMKLQLTISKLKELFKTVGSTLIPILTPLLASFEKIVDKVSEWVNNNKELTGVILAIVGVLSTFSLVTGAIVVGVTALIGSFLFWKTTFSFIGNGISSLVGKLFNFTKNLTSVKKGVEVLKAPFSFMGKFFGLWGDLFSKLGTKILGLINIFKGWAGSIGSFISKAIGLPKIMSVVTGAFSGIKGAIFGSLGVFKTFMLNIGSAIMRLPILGKALTLFGKSFGLLKGAFMSISGPLGIMLGGFAIIGTVLALAGDDLNKFIGDITQFLTGIITKITENLPMLVQKGMEIIISILQGIINNLPMLIEAGINILIFLINAITENLPIIIEAAIGIINAIITFISENLPMIIDAGIKILLALVDAIITNLPMLIEAGVQMVKQIVKTLIENAPKLLAAAKELVNKLKEELKKAAERLKEAGRAMVDKILDGIKGAWNKVKSWVSDKVASLPIIGKLVKIRPEVENPEMPNPETITTPLNLGFRNSLLSDLSSIGATPKQKSTVKIKTENDNELINAIRTLANSLNTKETVINTSFNIDGKEIARGTAYHMQEEIDKINRRKNRLGGVL